VPCVRPILVLKSDQGFVGYKSGSVKLECNKATYETIQVERGELGLVHFKGKTFITFRKLFKKINLIIFVFSKKSLNRIHNFFNVVRLLMIRVA